MDAQYWGVAQRRKRIFLVADFAGRSAPQILFKQDRLFGDPAQSQGQGQGASATAQASVRDTSGSRAGRIEGSEVFAFHINQREETIDLNGISGALMATTNMQMQTFLAEPMAFAANQRDEVRDLHDVAAALGAQPGMKQQTFVAGVVTKGNGDCFLTPETHTSLVCGGGQAGQGYPCVFTAGFSAGAGASAGSIGYGEELAPTLKGSASGNCMPSVLCLNDQGGSVMDCSEEVAGTLRAQEHGHQPLVFDTHAQDSRYKEAGSVSQTVTSSFGEGGGNTPLVMATQQGGAEIGVGICPAITAAAGMSGNNQPVLFENHGIDSRYTGPHPVAPTMSARYGTGGNNQPLVAQEHTAFSRQRVDVFHPDEIASTQSARQHKDATDLVHQKAEGCLLIRRLTPLECERLQGFPDGWTDLPGASDSARYKALGNSVAIPCVDFVLRGVAYFLSEEQAVDD